MAKLLALYRKPANPNAFDAYYAATHQPLAKTLPGLRRYEVSAGPVSVSEGLSPFHRISILHFDSVDSLNHALWSPQGSQVWDDLSNFAQAGVELFVFETDEV